MAHKMLLLQYVGVLAAGVGIAFAVGGQPVPGLFDGEKHAVLHLISDVRLAYCMTT